MSQVNEVKSMQLIRAVAATKLQSLCKSVLSTIAIDMNHNTSTAEVDNRKLAKLTSLSVSSIKTSVSALVDSNVLIKIADGVRGHNNSPAVYCVNVKLILDGGK